MASLLLHSVQTASFSRSTPHKRFPGGYLYSVRPHRGSFLINIHVYGNLRSTVRASADFGSAGLSIAEQLLEAEDKLQALFDPDRLPPKAAVVAEHRRRINELRRQLDGVAVSTIDHLRQAEVASSISSAAANRARLALQQVEAELSFTAEEDDEDMLTEEEMVEAQVLAADNARLRKRAHFLLYRQRQLQELLREHLEIFNQNVQAAPRTPHAYRNSTRPTQQHYQNGTNRVSQKRRS